MTSIEGKVALVTGGSSGIGKETVRSLIAADAVVYAAARRTDRMNDIEALGARVIAMDVTEEASMSAAVHAILAAAGGIDILVNNAGYGSYGAVEDVPVDEARRQFEVNLFGLARLTQLVLPGMRARKFGKIVNISSMGGKIYTPFGAWYHATKFALEGWSDCLRIETAPFGIDVIIVEPGGIATEWGQIAADNLRKTSGSGAYGEAASRAAANTEKTYKSGSLSKPDLIAKVITRAVTAHRPRTRYHAGAYAGLLLFLRRWLSDRMFDRVVTSLT